MEILSPASNMKHIDVAIEEKSDAVYGGLKNWNARNKAINFTEEEYSLLIDMLHSNGIKFYLTLNILMLDDEINDVINFLENNSLPDAFIVADIGLINVLHDKFPDVPLHFSTQFGVHNIFDVDYIESLGGSRAILARELTLKEIKNIQNSANIELECFVWGSQCLSFSGLCFFGTIINGGGGNRGKCIITCRDIYSVGEHQGHYLYVPDMDSINLLGDLDHIDCFKLEGRRRDPEEIRSIIRQIHEGKKSDCNRGYQYGTDLAHNNLYEPINRRVKGVMPAPLLSNVGPNDICIKYDNDRPIEFSTDYSNPNVMYVYTEIKKDYDLMKKNISLDLTISNNNAIREVLLVNHKGEGHTFYEKDSDYIKFNPTELINELEKHNNINLYKIKYKRNNDDNLLISDSLYNQIIEYILKDTIDLVDRKKRNIIKLNKIFLETNKIDVVDEFIDDSFVKIIYDIETVDNLKNIVSIVEKYDDKIIYKLPIFNWSGLDLREYFDALKDKEVMFTRLTQLYLCKDITFKKKYTDYTIYIWNKHSLNYLKKYNIDIYTASFELSFNKNRQILSDVNYQVLLGGWIPMVYTRGCFKHLFGCSNCRENQLNAKHINNVDKNLKFKVYCNDDYRTLINSYPILNDYSRFDNLENVSFRYVSNHDDIDTIKEIIKILKEDNYYDKLKKTDSFKNSYECNLLEGKE